MSEQITQHVLPSTQDVVDIPQHETNDDKVDTLDYVTLYPSILTANKEEIIAKVAEKSPEKAAELKEQINALEKKEKEKLKWLMEAASPYRHVGIPMSYQSSIYSVENATSVTATGRKMINEVKEKLEKQGYEITYCDTDVIMVRSNPGVQSTIETVD